MSSYGYTISEVCDLLHISDSKLRYIEKILPLSVERDKLNNRIYDENALEQLKQIIEYKNKGLGYKAIKEKMQKLNSEEIVNNEIQILNEEIALTETEELINEKSFIFYGDDFERAIAKIQEGICSTINEAVSEKFKGIDDISQKISRLEQQNREISNKLDKQVKLDDLEKHYRELDNKIIDILERKDKPKKSFIKRLFRM